MKKQRDKTYDGLLRVVLCAEFKGLWASSPEGAQETLDELDPQSFKRLLDNGAIKITNINEVRTDYLSERRDPPKVLSPKEIAHIVNETRKSLREENLRRKRNKQVDSGSFRHTF